MGNISLTIAAVAILAVAIGQVQAEPINVPGGDFQLYKPGTGYTITATFAPGNNYAAGLGDNLTVEGDGIADYSDGTSGGVVDCPGWTGPIRRTNTNDLWSSGIGDDGTTAFNAFGTWSGGNGSLAESADSLGDIAGGAIYTVSAMVEGPAGPLTLELLAGGVVMPPSSSVTPASPTVGWEEISRTYDADAIADYVGEPITIVIGIAKLGDELYGSRVRFDDVSLSYHVLGPPSQATNPNPSNGATDVWPDSSLNWTAGDGSESSDVYFGTDPTPDSNEFQDNRAWTFFDLDTMAEDTTYYWRIDAVNTYGTTPGEVWSFTTIADSSTCPPVLVLPPVTGCDGLVLTDPSSIDTQSAGIITNTGGGIGRTDSTTVNNGESIDILDSGCFQLGKDGNDFALSFWLKATGAAQIIGTKTQYNGNQGFIVYVDGDSRLRVASSEGSGNTSLRSEPFQLNEWVHVVINYVNDGVDATFEVNVNLAPTFGFAYGNVYNSNLRIGDEGWGSISSFDVCAFQSWGRVLSRNEIKALYFDKAPRLGLSSAILSSVMSDIMDHLTDTTPLTGTEIEGLTETFVENGRFLDENTAVMIEAFDLVNYYETNEGPLFINGQTAGGFARVQQGGDGFELERAIFTIQQAIHDRIFEPENCQSCQSLFNGKVFETSNFFPGACDDPVNPETVYEVDINGTNPEMWGKPVCYGPLPARRPTGFYLAPGSIGEVTVPTAMVNQGFEILVGGHAVDKLKYYKSNLQRFDRVAKFFPITSEVTSIANPFGGGIYIMVPYKANLGSQTVEIVNAVQSPFFSATSAKQTTLQEWTDTERLHPGPWADFESDKFMMTVPTSWIYNYADPVTQMEDWDLAMDAVSELLGLPSPFIRNLAVLYVQPDISIQHGAYGTGYPQVNQNYNPNASTNGNSSHFFLTDAIGWSTLYHELSHCQLFSKFPGHTESMVNLPYIYVATEKFGVPLVEAFTDSMHLGYLENISVDQAALTWFVTENFRNGNPMDITDSEYNEVRYQHRGYGRYVEIATLFGWEVLIDFYYQEQLDYIAGTPSDGLHSTDSRIFRLSKAAGVDLTPLIHCWGVHPVNLGALQAAIATEGLPMSQAIYDRLIHYKDIIPANNAEFWDHYRTIYPTEPTGGNPLYQYGWYNVWKYIYDTDEGTAAKNAMQDIIDLYYPEIEFADYPVVKSDATEGSPYNESLALDVTAPGDEIVIFDKLAGPSWLNVAPDGTLTGVARHANIGLNDFVIRAISELGITFVGSDGSVQITVLDTFTGELGLPDFAGFAGHWLDSGCVDVPACGGADLTGDRAVGIDDLHAFAGLWLAD